MHVSTVGLAVSREGSTAGRLVVCANILGSALTNCQAAGSAALVCPLGRDLGAGELLGHERSVNCVAVEARTPVRPTLLLQHVPLFHRF